MWQVKDDQPSLKDAIATAFTGFDEAPPSNRERRRLGRERAHAETCDRAHGRLEYRRLTSTTALNEYLDWPGVGQVFQLERRRTVKGRTTTDIAYGITSLRPGQADAKRLLQLTRGHWHIENKLFHGRDRSFGEDHCRVRTGRAPHLLAALRNLTVGLLRPAGLTRVSPTRRAQTSHAQALRHLAYHWPQALALLRDPPQN